MQSIIIIFPLRRGRRTCNTMSKRKRTLVLSVCSVDRCLSFYKQRSTEHTHKTKDRVT